MSVGADAIQRLHASVGTLWESNDGGSQPEIEEGG